MASSRSRPPSSGAFTLVELMVVIIILAIVAAITVPSLSSGADFQALSAARMLMADLQYAQDFAVTHQADWNEPSSSRVVGFQVGRASAERNAKTVAGA